MCGPGSVLTYTNSCIPCPAGWACGLNVSRCAAGTWSSTGSALCSNCSSCTQGREVAPCALVSDVVCHACPAGFEYRGGLCMPLKGELMWQDVAAFLAICVVSLFLAWLCKVKSPSYSRLEAQV